MSKSKLVTITIISFILVVSSCGGVREKSNILLITVDTLRRDHLTCYGYPRRTSPFIDQLAQGGLLFEHTIAPQPTTAPSHASILTSLHPLTHQTTTNASPLSENVQTIAEVLRANGWHTIGTVASPFLSSTFQFSQGFDSFSGDWETKSGLDSGFERVAESVNASLFKQVDEYLSDTAAREKPLFIWVHYFDPHSPYREHENIRFSNKLPERDGNMGILHYDQEIRYTDEHIQELYQYLEQKGLTRNLVTCVTADHGEEFFEHGQVFGHADIYSETTFVPLIFHGRGIPAKKRIDSYVSVMDIAPSLLNMFGLSFDYSVEGKDLLKKSARDKMENERDFLIVGNEKYTTSVQLLRPPFSYIQNFDHHCNFWFYSERKETIVPDDRFVPCERNFLEEEGDESSYLIFSPPANTTMGLNYAVFQANLKNNHGLSVQVEMLYSRFTQLLKLAPGLGAFTIVYPVTFRDRIRLRLKTNPGTIVENFRYAYISKEEFPEDPLFRKIENPIFENLRSIRKDKETDEFFNLYSDVRMEKDLSGSGDFEEIIEEYTKTLFELFQSYIEKNAAVVKR